MKIGIIGATGKVGNKVLQEATQRGHEVTAIVRNAAKLDHQDVKRKTSSISQLMILKILM